MPIQTSYPKTFPHAKPYAGASRNYRAYADVRLIGPTATSSTHEFLVDTGSDYTIVPERLAQNIGIPTNVPLPQVNFTTASGHNVALPYYTPLDIEIGAYILPGIRILITSASGFIPILGRPELIAAFDFGFNTTHWHWG